MRRAVRELPRTSLNQTQNRTEQNRTEQNRTEAKRKMKKTLRGDIRRQKKEQREVRPTKVTDRRENRLQSTTEANICL